VRFTSTSAIRRRRVLLALPLTVAALTACWPPASAAAKPILAATPYMGWDTSYAFGPRFDEATVLEQASNLITSGLQAAGYRLIWLDAGWWQGKRTKAGQIEVSSMQWPHGMAWLAMTLHREGFRVGLYTDAGINGCNGGNEGMYGHYQQDINTFAGWGFDAVKVDWCGANQLLLTSSVAYGKVHEAIVHNSSHRPMMLEICDFPEPGQLAGGRPSFSDSSFANWVFGPSDGTSWRTDTDIGSASIGVPWRSVVRNMESDATEPQAARTGHWNDPGYLGPGLGMTDTQFQTQFAMWSMLAAPLMISANLSGLTPTSLATVTNKQLIEIDQDKLGRQGIEVPPGEVSTSPNSPAGEAWMRPLSGGRFAVALLNLGGSTVTIATRAQAIGIPSAGSYTLTDAWTDATITTSGTISASVPSDSTAVFVVTTG
jgi:alpha-galactosidase